MRRNMALQMQYTPVCDLHDSDNSFSHSHKVAKVACSYHYCVVFFEKYNDGITHHSCNTRPVLQKKNQQDNSLNERRIPFFFSFYIHLVITSQSNVSIFFRHRIVHEIFINNN